MSLHQLNRNGKTKTKSKVNGETSSLTETARLLDAALPKGVSQGDMRRRDGDSSVYKFYLRSAGLLSPSIIAAAMIILAFCDGFPNLWLKWWAEDNAREPNANLGKWLGVYVALGAGAGLSLAVGAWYIKDLDFNQERLGLRRVQAALRGHDNELRSFLPLRTFEDSVKVLNSRTCFKW